MTADPFVYYDSAPDSGYSVDNIAPFAPTGFVANYVSGTGNVLAWGESEAADFQYFKIYRSPDPNFIPSAGNLVHQTIETGSEPSAGMGPVYYKISAVNFNGNEGAYAATAITVGVDNPTALTFALEAVRPNPTRGDRLSVEFVLARAGAARIEVLDVGRAAGDRARSGLARYRAAPGGSGLGCAAQTRALPGSACAGSDSPRGPGGGHRLTRRGAAPGGLPLSHRQA